jgi:hypothetical protein
MVLGLADFIYICVYMYISSYKKLKLLFPHMIESYGTIFLYLTSEENSFFAKVFLNKLNGEVPCLLQQL